MRISDWSSDVCSSDLVHENGVELQGAWLVGSLNLATTKTPYALYLNYCRIEKIEAIHSELAVLGLDGSCLQAGLDAGGLRCGGGVYLRGGFHALDTVNLVGDRKSTRLNSSH